MKWNFGTPTTLPSLATPLSPLTATPEAIFPLTWRHVFNIPLYKIIALCRLKAIYKLMCGSFLEGKEATKFWTLRLSTSGKAFYFRLNLYLHNFIVLSQDKPAALTSYGVVMLECKQVYIVNHDKNKFRTITRCTNVQKLHVYYIEGIRLEQKSDWTKLWKTY